MLSRVSRTSIKVTPRLARAFSEVSIELSDIERAAGQGRTVPWHYTIPATPPERTDLQKAQHRGETPDYDKTKGQQRVAGRMDGLRATMEQVTPKVDALKDEDGVFQNPHCKELPSMTFNDCMVNYHFDYIGLKSPPFGEAEISEIEAKTTVTRDNIHHGRWEWINLEPDMIDYQSLVDDCYEMYKKGVSYRTINLWLDYISGSGSLYRDSLRNLNWTRIDS